MQRWGDGFWQPKQIPNGGFGLKRAISVTSFSQQPHGDAGALHAWKVSTDPDG
jgi:hypothetical protein